MAYYRVTYQQVDGQTAEFEIIADSDDDAGKQLNTVCGVLDIVSVTVID